MSWQPAKRQREHEELAAYNDDHVREKKKHRSLPLRSPQKPSKGLRTGNTRRDPQKLLSTYTSSLTPVDSDDEAGFINLYYKSNPENHQVLRFPRLFEPDCDISMDVDVPESLTSMGQDHGRSDGIIQTVTPPLRPQQSNCSTMGAASSADSRGMALDLTEDPLWWACPRLPSPVSDNGNNMSDVEEASADAEMVDERTPPEPIPSNQVNPSTMDAEAADVRERLSSLDLPAQSKTEQTSTNKPKRLGFSMGYRADCDKCRRKVPGHYSHIIGC
ncbi:hypothetical protein BDW74DRAFT_161530 [Aspergillus multicolor]|uniref:uncharacterized protein n=1 Tax=Aspergillus multicolor TaxID=41759 RepID=UPI003CCD4AD8